MNALVTVSGTEAHAAVATRGLLFTGASVTIVRFGVVTLIYLAAFSALGGTVRAVSLPVAVWSMACYFAVLGWNLRYVAKDIRDDVRSGAIEVRLTRPRSYLALIIAARIGRGFPEFLAAVVASAAVAWIAVGPPPVPYADPAWVLCFLLLTAGSIVLSVEVYTLVGLSAIWLEESEPAYWIVDKAVMLLGGSYMPVALFPGWLAAVASWTPFGLAMAFPRAVQLHAPAQLLPLLAAQGVWIVLIAVALMLVWSRAERHLSVNGG